MELPSLVVIVGMRSSPLVCWHHSQGANTLQLLTIDIRAEVVAGRHVEGRISAAEEGVWLDCSTGHLFLGIERRHAAGRCGADCRQFAFYERDSVGRGPVVLGSVADLYVARADR